MFNHRLDEAPERIVILHWFLMSFSAGCINAGAFLATGRFASHITGFATLFGVQLVNHQVSGAIGILTVPFFFLLGAFLAGMLIDYPIHHRKYPHFDYVMGLSSLCLFLAAGGGWLTDFGAVVGSVMVLKPVYLILSLLCMACGLQNGAITSSSGSSIRTTHLTGLSTDLGLGLAKLLAFQDDEEKLSAEAYANRLRAGSIASFIVGSAIGAWIFVRLGYVGFALSGTISAYAAWHGRRAKITPHKWGLN